MVRRCATTQLHSLTQLLSATLFQAGDNYLYVEYNPPQGETHLPPDQGAILTELDTIPPEFTYCPEDVTYTALPGQIDIVANWDPPLYQDNVAIRKVSFNYAPRTPLAIADSPIEILWEVFDQRNSEQCSWTVSWELSEGMNGLKNRDQ